MTISLALVGCAAPADSFDCVPAGIACEFGAAGGVLPCVSVGVTGAGGWGGVCAKAGVATAIPAITVVAISDPLNVLLDILFPFNCGARPQTSPSDSRR
jgi:hypothetical protein